MTEDEISNEYGYHNDLLITRRHAVMLKVDDSEVDEIRKLAQNASDDLLQKVYQYFIENNLNPSDYEIQPNFPGYNDDDFANNKFTVSVSLVPVRRIDGVKITQITFND